MLKDIIKGVEKLHSVVASTMGAAGKPALLQPKYHHGYPIVTRDGVTAAMAVNSKCPLEQMGIELVRQAALGANSRAGDGTSSATVLATAMIKARMELHSRLPNLSTTLVERGMQAALTDVISLLGQHKFDADGVLKQVAVVACNNDLELGGVISEAYTKVGAWGSITVKASGVGESSLREVQGAEFETEIHPQFLLGVREKVLKNPKILVTDFVLNSVDDFSTDHFNVVQACINTRTPLTIITPSPRETLLREVVMQNMQGVPVFVIAAPEFGQERFETMRDIAEMTGGELVTQDFASEFYADKSHLGTCKEVVIRENKFTLSGYEVPQSTLDLSIKKVEDKKEPTAYDKRRIGRLSGKGAEITVVRRSDSELKRVLDRVEDALNATRAALRFGAVAGGGVALRDIGYVLEPPMSMVGAESEGYKIVVGSLSAPYSTIILNSGLTPVSLPKGEGINVLTLEKVVMKDIGIIDPYEVVVSSLSAAVEIAQVIPSIGAIVLDETSESND